MRTVRDKDGDTRSAISTFTQLLSSDVEETEKSELIAKVKPLTSRPSESDVKEIACQHSRTFETAQTISFHFSVPDLAHAVMQTRELHPPANEISLSGLKRREGRSSQGMVTLEERG